MKRLYTALRDRPITDRERWHALTLAAFALIAAGTLLSLTTPQPPGRRPYPTLSANTTHDRRTKLSLPPAAARAARVFLTGYLAYTYGHSPASHIRDATPALLHELRAYPPRVSPAIAARDPRILALHPINTPGRVGVSALVNDGTLINYPIGVRLVVHNGRWLVTRLVSE